MLDYNVKIGLVAMRRNTTDRPKGTFLTWSSAERRGKESTEYIEKNFKSKNVTFVDNKGIGIENLFDEVDDSYWNSNYSTVNPGRSLYISLALKFKK